MKLTIVKPTDHLTIIFSELERLLLTQTISRLFMRSKDPSPYLSDALAATMAPSVTRGDHDGNMVVDFKWYPKHVDGIFKVLQTHLDELKFNLEIARDEAPSAGGVLKELADIEEINKLGKILSRVLTQADKQGYNPQ